MPQLRHDIQQLADLGDIYANAAPDLFDFLNNAVDHARTLNQQQGDLDPALLAAAGFGNTGADIFERAGRTWRAEPPTWCPPAQLLDTYSPELFCTIRNYHDIEPKAATFLGGNGYSLTPTPSAVRVGSALNPGDSAVAAAHWAARRLAGLVGGAPNPYVYPDNLPRVNARGGPGGAPGCWQHDHPRPVARALSGDGHRQQHRAVQPLRHRFALRDRVRLGPPSRGEHDQPMKITGTVVKTRHLLAGAAALHRDDRRGVRSDALRPDQQLLRGVQQRQRAAAGPVRPRLRRGDRQGQIGDAGRRRPAGRGWTSTSTARCRCTSRRPHRSATST